VNPLGFQVVRYRKDAETLPREIEPAAARAPTPTNTNQAEPPQ
jgi:hypothetical protein